MDSHVLSIQSNRYIVDLIKLHGMDTNSFRQKEESRQGQLRKIYDFVMGLIWTAAGIFFITAKYFADGLGLDSLTTTLFGIAALVYGVFRFYRGFTANKRR
jgi:hypothetical protein